MPRRISDIVRLFDDAQALKSVRPSANVAVISPHQIGSLTRIAWAGDVFEGAKGILTRAEAIGIPAVAKARHVLVSLLADKPLRAGTIDATGKFVPLDLQPAWLTSTSSDVSVWHRQAWTIDDLLFYGCSLWVVERDDAGEITRADRWPIDDWEVDADARIKVNGIEVDADSVIYIPGPHEGILNANSTTLRGSLELERAWIMRAKDPIPVIDLHDEGESQLTDEEAQELVETWQEARERSATAYTPRGITAKVLGTLDPALFIEGRNFAKTDIANITNLPAALLDASLSTASLTYSTQEGRVNELALYTLPFYTGPLCGRLSLDDIVPEGQAVRFDLSALTSTDTAGTTGPALED